MQTILESENVDSLEALRVKYLGKKGELTGILRQMGKLSPAERPQMGQLANQLREEIESEIETRRKALNEARLEMKLLQETVDVTLPGKKQVMGHKHPMYNVLDQIKDIFIGMGFEIVDGPEVELSDYNFTKLNIDEGHPSREWTDTFYFTEDSRICLRTQTSPMQIHAMETKPLPIRMIAPGRVYRKDEVDATHSPMFHQIEGMVIDKGVTMSDLKATLNLVVEKIYGAGTVTRFRPHHFPFPLHRAELRAGHPVPQVRRCGLSDLQGRGLDEIITYSFISPAYYDKVNLQPDSPLRDSLRILNPLGEDTSIMRTTTLPSMLEILTRNYNYRNREARLYEIGRTYHKHPDGLADEPRTLSLGAYGPDMDFFVLKGWVEELLAGLGMTGARFCQERTDPSYHPGRCAVLWVGDTRVGILGQIHPRVMRNYSVDTEVFCAQLSFEALFALRGGVPVFRPLPRYPSVQRDIAVICDLLVPAGDLEATIRSAGGERLIDCAVFDVYTGHHIVEGKKSVAFRLTMRDENQTLTEGDRPRRPDRPEREIRR